MRIVLLALFFSSSGFAQEMVSDAQFIQGCQKLGEVHSRSIWGGVGGKKRVVNEIKERSRNMGGDTILLVDQNTGAANIHSELNGVAYNCANKEEVKAEMSKEILEKAKKCQKKGGVWVNDTCQIEVD